MDGTEPGGPYRLDELGWLQFEQLCAEIVGQRGLMDGAWGGEPGRAGFVTAHDGLTLGEGDVSLAGPVLVVVVWAGPDPGRGAGARRLRLRLDDLLREQLRDAPAPRSLLLATTARVSAHEVRQAHAALRDVEVAVLGPDELGSILDASAGIRYRAPFVLGVRDLDGLIPDGVRGRCTADIEAAAALASVFVPTRAYTQALETLRRHRFAVLTGPPEMGKTAIARMIALAALTDGWEVHECLRPDELWQAYARDRRQVFVADDAFGSTEYRPDAAERWALELDRVLRAMDERHWLVWTSRPAPLHAGLRRVHREHGVERWPQPAEVGVDAAELDLAEKALILFRHARAAGLQAGAVELVRSHGFDIVSHPHFTPERIRRFVADRLPGLAAMTRAGERVSAAVRDEIREPTAAMAASFNALGVEHRALLVALLDVPPGPVPERELAASARRHADGGMPRPPGELVDRLSDHFLRVVPPASVTWVHPSWRDLVVEQLRRDGPARRRFLARCALDGLLLALSVGGGVTGERRYPLLVEDADWDTLSDRLADLVTGLEGSGPFRLLSALSAASAEASSYRERSEVGALAERTLALLRREWDAARAPVPVGLLGQWFALAARVAEPPPPPELGPTWIELVPVSAIDVGDLAELSRVDDWATLVGVLAEHAQPALETFGFPERQAPLMRQLAADATRVRRAPAAAELLARALRRLAAAAPGIGPDALVASARLDARHQAYARELEPPARPRTERTRPDRTIVERILADL